MNEYLNKIQDILTEASRELSRDEYEDLLSEVEDEAKTRRLASESDEDDEEEEETA